MNILTNSKEALARRALSLLLALVCVLVVFGPASVRADPPPIMGQYYYGSTASGGQPFAANTSVTVTVNDAAKSYITPATVNQQGNYGYSPSELLIPGDLTGQNGAVPGDELAFYMLAGGRTLRARLYNVATAQWLDKIPFTSGVVTQLNLATPMITATVTAAGGGTLSPQGRVPVGYHGSQAFALTPDVGHKIQGVEVDGQAKGPLSSYTFNDVTADHTLTASFDWLTYTITPTAGLHGKIQPATPQTVRYGADQGFTFVPDPGYKVDAVKLNGVVVSHADSYTVTNVTANHVIDVSFKLGFYAYLPIVCK